MTRKNLSSKIYIRNTSVGLIVHINFSNFKKLGNNSEVKTNIINEEKPLFFFSQTLHNL